MKKVSAKMFFTVLWSGLCQAIGWFSALFGYKRDGKAAKIIWGVFATSSAIVMASIAFLIIAAFINEAWRWHDRQYGICDSSYCYGKTYISRDIYFHNHVDGKGYIYNRRTARNI